MNVRIGMNMLLWGTNITTAHIPVFEGLAAAGYDGVEIPLGGQMATELQAMAAACDDLALERTAAAFVGESVNPISPDPAMRAAAIDYLKQRIDDACLIGADILVGAVYQTHKYFTGSAPTAREWDWSADYLRICGEYAQTRGVRLGLEFLNRFEVFLINTSADCRRMVEQVGLPNVGVHYDTHHANIEDPRPREALRGCADVLNHVHLSESHRGALGSGQVDWEGSFEALREIDYQGWLVIEAFGTADRQLAVAANVWRDAFSSPEALYTDGIAFIRRHL
ncbi:MAG: sugar phosphate isomerase/epimerase family protein [Halioglobus sp.]|nr:sugar phosphate isomerase/epimerase family protein [Halioglobus sp.]